MKTIWKFSLHPSTSLQMPIGSLLLCVSAQGDGACLWALVDPDQPVEQRDFNCYGTGHNIPDDPGQYVGIVFIGSLVFHVFETTASKASL